MPDFSKWATHLPPQLIATVFLYLLVRAFLPLRPGRLWRLSLFLFLWLCTGLVIWVGDHNLLYITPFFFLLFLLCSRGDFLGRLAMTAIFFCLIMSAWAILDTYSRYIPLPEQLDSSLLPLWLRPGVAALLYLFLRSRLPAAPPALPRRLWNLVLGLACMPLAALVAVVLLTFSKYESLAVNSLAMNQGLVVLPIVFFTSLVLLFVILSLADHEALEQSSRLAGLREIYYQGLQRELHQVRSLRHDLRNHITVLQGLLTQGQSEKAMGYLDQIALTPGLGGGQRFCRHEFANVVLSAKAADMAARGLECNFQADLPEQLPIADTDLCSLLGNALDNAMEAAEKAGEKVVSVRCRAERGLFMLRVENALAGDEKPDLSTTKPDRGNHGFGLAGMREIAVRHGGSLEARAVDGRFILTVCLPL